MTNIELYINERLCDIQNPESLGVRLNRVLINPAELSSKDAQYSYSITIPSTPINDAIFSYVNVEEVKNKFNVYHIAQLYVDGVLIFNGRFKMNEIDGEGNYKGNLVVPAKKTIKEIFGEKKMNEVDPWLVTGFPTVVETLNYYNTKKMKDDQLSPFIQPLVLYGLLPKTLNEKGEYTSKTLWDKTVRLGIEDFPPSINCMKTIEHIFSKVKDDKGNASKITGTAFEDPRLVNLYMSYQNPTDYQQEWNWGSLGSFEIKGFWSNVRDDLDEECKYERLFYKNDDAGKWRNFYAVDLFRSTGLDVSGTIDGKFGKTGILDNGTNVYQSKENNVTKDGKELELKHQRVHITIPRSGLYKIELDVRLTVITDEKNPTSTVVGVKNTIKPAYKNDTYYIRNENTRDGQGYKKNDFTNARYEVKLLRDFGEGSFDLSESKLDGVFYRDNLPQDKDDKITRYFPKPSDKCVQMVDPLQNSLLVNGFRWGDYGRTRGNGSLKDEEYNLLEAKTDGLDNKNKHCRILAAKNGWSWDNKYDQKNKVYSAINSLGYGKVVGSNISDDGDVDKQDSEINLKIDKFEIRLDNASNFISHENESQENDEYIGKGNLKQVVWLEKGEHLTLVSVTDSGHYLYNVYNTASESVYTDDVEGFMVHDIDFYLKVTPFKKSYEWIKVDNKGTGITGQTMNWNDTSDFSTDKIDLSKFLPSDVKIDTWLDNFCRAFNLQLTQTDEGKFQMNVKPVTPVSTSESVLDLDAKTCITKATNQPLGLPSEYKLGFKIEKEEQGYVESPKLMGHYEDGGGSLKTGDLDGKALEQGSDFSYNWYKTITKEQGETPEMKLLVPVISHKDVWDESENNRDYAEMQKKTYSNNAQRFWYHSGINDNLGEIWRTVDKDSDKKAELYLPRLSNTLGASDSFTLDYHEEYNSILTTYFNIIATNDSNYTYVECYLTPDEYDQLDGTKLVKLNGDLYYVADVDGYDPLGKNKTKLKLIRKI